MLVRSLPYNRFSINGSKNENLIILILKHWYIPLLLTPLANIISNFVNVSILQKNLATAVISEVLFLLVVLYWHV